ncbi:hypothetical protein ACN1S0_003546 [Vibrio cholerae]|nr:hypothetical protein [Vibrio cholerae]
MDYLGKAASLCQEHRVELEKKNYDLAREKIYEAKKLYSEHAETSKFSLAQTLALTGRLHKPLALISKAEGNHSLGLMHIVYYAVCAQIPCNQHVKIIKPYFNRCKFTVTTFDDVQNYINSLNEFVDFNNIETEIDSWI